MKKFYVSEKLNSKKRKNKRKARQHLRIAPTAEPEQFSAQLIKKIKKIYMKGNTIENENENEC